jgi:hypothetical protein
MGLKHTTEPWKPGDNNTIYRDGLIFVRVSNCPLSEDNAKENMWRILDCVNGCKGIVDPETTIPELVAVARTLCQSIECGDEPQNILNVVKELYTIIAKADGSGKHLTVLPDAAETNGNNCSTQTDN